MENNYLNITIKLFKILKNFDIPRVKKNFIITDRSLTYKHPLGKLLVINEKQILFNKYNINRDIEDTRTDKKTNASNLKYFSNFIKDNVKYIKKLDHLGFSYVCQNLVDEVNKYKAIFINSPFKIYEESSTVNNSLWLFTGHKDYPQSPLVELVLQQGKSSWDNIWNPNIQIHLDTLFNEEDLNKAVNKYFKIKSYHAWELRLSRGLVLKALSLAKVDGVNFNLGLGTNIR